MIQFRGIHARLRQDNAATKIFEKDLAAGGAGKYTLVKEFPKPVRRLIGDLANINHLFVGLNWATMGKTPP